jgi:hypothetical protein
MIGKFFLIDKDIENKLRNEFGYDDLFQESKNIKANQGEGNSLKDLSRFLVDSIISQNWSRLGEQYFDLPSTDDMYKELKEKKVMDASSHDQAPK